MPPFIGGSVMFRKSVFLIPVFWLVCGGYSYCQYYENEYDVPFVPTNYNVVDRMLDMAKIHDNDILYDLGCGDGRIVITAAKRCNITGTGIDINPVRITESLENAKKAGVEDRVSFRVGNLFEEDFHDATVVTLYLLKSVNVRLRPRLLNELQPGTRIVSHDFDMGEWEPDNYSVVEYNDADNQSYRNHSVYFWTIPANFSGTWEVVFAGDKPNDTSSMSLTQSFQKVSGTFNRNGRELILRNAVISGPTVRFFLESPKAKSDSTIVYSGTINGNSIEGSVTLGSGPITWQARRDPATTMKLDIPENEN